MWRAPTSAEKRAEKEAAKLPGGTATQRREFAASVSDRAGRPQVAMDRSLRAWDKKRALERGFFEEEEARGDEMEEDDDEEYEDEDDDDDDDDDDDGDSLSSDDDDDDEEEEREEEE